MLKKATLTCDGYAHRKVKPFFAYFLLAWTKSQAHVEARLDDLACSNSNHKHKTVGFRPDSKKKRPT
jgi:hypothetical protein